MDVHRDVEGVPQTRGLVRFSLDVADYPHATRKKVAAWVLLAMGRLARQLPEMQLQAERVSAVGDVVQVNDASSCSSLFTLVVSLARYKSPPAACGRTSPACCAA